MKATSVFKSTLYYEYFHISSRKTWFHKIILTKEEIVLINQLRYNHTNENLHRVNMVWAHQLVSAGTIATQSNNKLTTYCSIAKNLIQTRAQSENI